MLAKDDAICISSPLDDISGVTFKSLIESREYF